MNEFDFDEDNSNDLDDENERDSDEGTLSLIIFIIKSMINFCFFTRVLIKINFN